MRIERRIYTWVCDHQTWDDKQGCWVGCGNEVTQVRGEYDFSLPEGWIRHTVHDCGSTGYSTEEEWCSECAKLEQLDQAKLHTRSEMRRMDADAGPNKVL